MNRWLKFSVFLPVHIYFINNLLKNCTAKFPENTTFMRINNGRVINCVSAWFFFSIQQKSGLKTELIYLISSAGYSDANQCQFNATSARKGLIDDERTKKKKIEYETHLKVSHGDGHWGNSRAPGHTPLLLLQGGRSRQRGAQRRMLMPWRRRRRRWRWGWGRWWCSVHRRGRRRRRGLLLVGGGVGWAVVLLYGREGRWCGLTALAGWGGQAAPGAVDTRLARLATSILTENIKTIATFIYMNRKLNLMFDTVQYGC